MCQLELFARLVEIKIVNSFGQTIQWVEISDVQDLICKNVKEKRLWLYIDGIHSDAEKITKNMISSSKEIIMTNALVGG